MRAFLLALGGAPMRPHLITHNLASLDGRLTTAPDVLLLAGDERWTRMAGEGDAYQQLIREVEPDAILEGSGSFVTDDATGPFAREAVPPDEAVPDFLPSEIVDRPGHRGWFVVVDGRGRVRWAFKEYPDPAWGGWHLLVLVSRSTPAAYLTFLREEGIPYVVAGERKVDLRLALRRLGETLGVRRILSTAGGRLQGALLRAGLVDEVSLELVPALIGGRETPSLFDGPPLGPDDAPTPLRITRLVESEGRIAIRATVERPDDDAVRESLSPRSVTRRRGSRGVRRSSRQASCPR